MKITLVVVGRIKERFYADAVAEYARRLSAYCTLNIVEVADEKTKENMSPAEEAVLLKKEGERILNKLPKDAYICALCIDGKQADSVEMSSWMEGLTVRGVSHIVFLIGGSVGLADEVIRQANEKISFSKLTFPHQLMRVVLLEQIYRWFKISKGEPYHK